MFIEVINWSPLVNYMYTSLQSEYITVCCLVLHEENRTIYTRRTESAIDIKGLVIEKQKLNHIYPRKT